MRRVLRPLGTTLALAGLALLAWAGLTWAWKDPFTTVYTKLEQRELAQAYERQVEAFRAPPVLVSAPEAVPNFRPVAKRYRASLESNDAVGRLRVPRLGLDMVVVEGTEAGPLKRGPGRYAKSFLPGEGKLIYVAGHRTTYGAPFARIDRLRPGDRIFLEVPYGTFEYRVTRHRIVEATDLEVLRPGTREVLALQACHPRFFASHRYIAYATPVAATAYNAR